MPCNASYTRFIFGKIFHTHCNLICTPMLTKFYSWKNVGVTWRNACVCLKIDGLWKTWMLNRIFLIKSILPRSWKCLRELLKIGRLRCARCNGVVTPRKKLLGKEKKNWRWSFQVSFLIHPNLEDEIHFKAGRFVTPWFSQGNKIFRETIMHK
jgi:hypothetical protein